MVDHWLEISSDEYDSSCGSDFGRTVSNALDGTTEWIHNTSEIHWFILDLGQTYTIKKIRGRSYRIRDPKYVNIYVSDDKENWGAAVATGITNWRNTQNWQETDTTDKDGRYIKAEIIETEDGNPGRLQFGPNPPTPIFDAYGDVGGAPPPANRFMKPNKYW